MSIYRMTYGTDTVTVELGAPEDVIRIDGEPISNGMQFASCSCRTGEAMRAAARSVWGQLYETEEAATADGRAPGRDEIVIWDDVEYAAI